MWQVPFPSLASGNPLARENLDVARVGLASQKLPKHLLYGGRPKARHPVCGEHALIDCLPSSLVGLFVPSAIPIRSPLRQGMLA